MFTKSKVAALTAELVGTSLLTLVILVVAQVTGGIGYYVSFAVGIILALLVMAFVRVSGAHFNPAITLALWTVRKVETTRAVLYIAVQLIGGLLAYLLFSWLVDTDVAGQASEFDSRVLVAELVGTAVLAFGVAAATYQRMTDGGKAAVIGLAVTAGVLIASVKSAAFLNPAVALGAQSWVWATYVLGPVLGALIGANLYNLLFAASDTPASEKAAKLKAAPEVLAADAEAEPKVTAKKKPAAKKTTKK
jgi:glycerol uptake facilitator-like aquaporin